MIEIASHAFPANDKCYDSKDIYHLSCVCVRAHDRFNFAMAIKSTTCRFLYELNKFVGLASARACLRSRKHTCVCVAVERKMNCLRSAMRIEQSLIININYFYDYSAGLRSSDGIADYVFG